MAKPKKAELRALTPKQQVFVNEYLVDLNGTQAAIRAGYSEKTANEQAAQLLAKLSIQQAVADAMKSRSERTRIDADWVLERLARDATADLADLYSESGALKPVHEWPMAWRTGLVAGIETVQERDGEDVEGKPFSKEITVSENVPTQVQALLPSIDDTNAALQQEMSTRADQTGYLGGLYMVRMQLAADGRTVSGGFALSGTGTGFHLGPNGLLIGNTSTNRYLLISTQK